MYGLYFNEQTQQAEFILETKETKYKVGFIRYFNSSKQASAVNHYLYLKFFREFDFLDESIIGKRNNPNPYTLETIENEVKSVMALINNYF